MTTSFTLDGSAVSSGFSYNTALTSDRDIVRFHTGDTDENAYFLHDAVIVYWLTEEASVAGAAIKGIRYILSQLARPDFSTDWISVHNKPAFDAYKEWLQLKAQELGVSSTGASATATIIHPYRVDSYNDSTDSPHAGTP